MVAVLAKVPNVADTVAGVPGTVAATGVLTNSDWVTCVAGSKSALPAWLAAMMQLPACESDTSPVVLCTVQIAGVRVL